MRKPHYTVRLTACLAALLIAAAAFADDGAAEKKDDAKWEPVTQDRLQLELELSGVFEAEQMWPLEVALEQTSATPALELVQFIPQGTRVAEGDVLFAFDTEAIDRALEAAELAVRSAEVARQQARHGLALTQRSVELQLDAARRTHARQQQDYERYMNIGVPLARKTAEFSLRGSQHRLEYEQEELKQLQKMYAEDELTEETEEIVLKRQRDAVEATEFTLEKAQEGHREAMDITIPRAIENLENALKQTRLELDRAEQTLPLEVEQAKQKLIKAELDLDDARRKFDELRADRERLIVRSPGDGVLYYGACERGTWKDVPAVAAQMREGGKLKPNTVFATVVQPSPLFLRTTVAEADIVAVRPGQRAIVTATALPHRPLPARVREVALLPVADGKYEVVLEVELADAAELLRAGMTAKAKLVTYDVPHATLLPLKAVQDDATGETHVIVRTADGKAEQRRVELGRRSATHAEVITGVKPGELVQIRSEGK